MPMMIDPASGWMYGFPKVLPDPAPSDVREWLIQQGYPRKLTEEPWFYCRYWKKTNEESPSN
jgi:hypothetical protein